tara:strand:+ start:115 stop:774 length:660 start_codon:yes stop_codon:yes gene_type:complete
MTTPREFEQGQAVFDAEGRPGEITQAFYDFDFGEWVYTVEGLGTRNETDLSAVGADYEEPPPLDIGTDADSEPEVEVEVEGPPPAEEIDIGTPRDISGYVVPPSGLSRSDVEAIVRSWVNLHRLEVNNALRALESDTEAIDKLTSDLDTLRDSISGLVLEQVRFRDREAEDLGALEEVDQTSLGGFIRNVGGFLLSPFEKIKGAMEEYILGEVRDGLNR